MQEEEKGLCELLLAYAEAAETDVLEGLKEGDADDVQGAV